MIKVISMDSSVHPDSNDVKMSHNIFFDKKWFIIRNQTKKLLKIIEILLPFGSHYKKLLKFSEYYVVENILHKIHVLWKEFLLKWKYIFW